MKTIALFNHKGGVSKTTTTFHLGWMLASQGSTVMLVDADPQCNLTGLVLGFRGPQELLSLYKEHPGWNIRDALRPAFESSPQIIEPVHCVEVDACENLLLLPGHIGLAEYDPSLGIAQALAGALPVHRNLPGAIHFLLQATGDRVGADYAIIDLSPGLGPINQNIVAISDYVIVPTSPDFFTVMALNSLAKVLPAWKQWSQKASQIPDLRDADYPFPNVRTKFLGTIIQRFRIRKGRPTTEFRNWISEVRDTIETKLRPELAKNDLLLPEAKYKKAKMDHSLVIGMISEFNSLIATSQKHRIPVFALDEVQLNQVGIVAANTLEKRDQFRDGYLDITEKILSLIK